MKDIVKMRIKRMNWFVKALTFGWASAITLAPFGIYIREEYMGYKDLVRHESIHWEQQMEMKIIPFYIWYFVEWLIKLLTPPMGAYKDISFEREANRYEEYKGYLKERESFKWKKYIRDVD